MNNKILILIVLVTSVLLSGCVDRDTQEYRIMNISTIHSESAFGHESNDYLSVLYIDKDGYFKQQKSTDVGGIRIELGNNTKFEKRYNNGNFYEFVLTIKNYSDIK